MACEQFDIVIRDNKTLQEIQPVSKFRRFHCRKELNAVGSFTLELDLRCGEVPPSLQRERYGIHVYRRRDRRRIFTGPFTSFQRKKTSDETVLVLAGADENLYLDDRIIVPGEPYKFATSYTKKYYTRQAKAETVMKDLVNLHLVENRPPLFRPIVIEPDLGRGKTVNRKIRFTKLLSELQNLARYCTQSDGRSGHRFEIQVVDDSQGRPQDLVFRLIPWRSTWSMNQGLEFSERLGNLLEYNQIYQRPDFNAVLAWDEEAGKGAYDINNYSRSRWGLIEHFIKRNGATTQELKEACWDALELEQGKERADQNMFGKITCDAVVGDAEGGPRFLDDWDLGYFARVLIYDPPPPAHEDDVVEVFDYIREWELEIDGETMESQIKAKIGNPQGKGHKDDELVPFLVDYIWRLEERLYIIEANYS